MSVEYFEKIQHLFSESLNALHKLWFDDWTDSCMPSNLIGAFRELIADNISVNGTVFDSLVREVHQALPRFYRHKIELVRRAISDYLLLAATKNYTRRELFRDEDVSEVFKLLIEDITLDWYECRVFALISGVNMYEQAVQIDGRTRLRRATKFEIRVILEESRFDIVTNMDIDLLNATQDSNIQVYILESKVSPEEPSNPRRISSGLIDESLDSLENLIVLFRVFCGIGFGTRLMKIGCWIDSSSSFSTRSPLYEVAPCDLMRSMTMSGKSMSVFPSIYELDSHTVDRIQEVWNQYNVMSDKAPYFLTHHLRSIIRYAQSLNERYLEDKIIDLAICVETLVWVGGELAADKVSSILGVETTQVKIKEDLNWLFEERNHVAHGGRLSIDRTSGKRDRVWEEVGDDFKQQLRRIEMIIRCLIIASIVVAKDIDERTEGKKAFRLLLEEVADHSRRLIIQQSIPQWLFAEIEESFR